MIDHFSVSQLGMFSRCPEQYRRVYIEDERIPPGISARIGSGVHKASEYNLKVKLATGVDEPLSTLQDVAAETYYHTLVREGVYIPPSKRSSSRVDMAAGKDTAVELTRVMHRYYAPNITPKLVESRVVLDLPGLSLPVVTVLDVYTVDGRLSDLKTSASRWPTIKADTSAQGTLYPFAVEQAEGVWPEKITFDVLVKTKQPILQTVETTRQREDLGPLVKRFQAMERQIFAGNFQAADPEAWCCSPDWCGFWWSCPYISPRLKILPKRSAA